MRVVRGYDCGVGMLCSASRNSFPNRLTPQPKRLYMASTGEVGRYTHPHPFLDGYTPSQGGATFGRAVQGYGPGVGMLCLASHNSFPNQLTQQPITGPLRPVLASVANPLARVAPFPII